MYINVRKHRILPIETFGFGPPREVRLPVSRSCNNSDRVTTATVYSIYYYCFSPPPFLRQRMNLYGTRDEPLRLYEMRYCRLQNVSLPRAPVPPAISIPHGKRVKSSFVPGTTSFCQCFQKTIRTSVITISLSDYMVFINSM